MTKGEIPRHSLKKQCNHFFYLIRLCLIHVLSFFIFCVLSGPRHITQVSKRTHVAPGESILRRSLGGAGCNFLADVWGGAGCTGERREFLFTLFKAIELFDRSIYGSAYEYNLDVNIPGEAGTGILV